MPVLSNSLVTRPLVQEELEVINFITNEIITDTRTLRFYYRKLPDNRVQIGTRSSITGADAANPQHIKELVDGLHCKFPVLTSIRIDYAWRGWIDVSHDMMPRIRQPDPGAPVFYAMGYGGTGLSFSLQAGKRMAELISGKTVPVFDLPIYHSELEYPNVMNLVRSRTFAPFRRLGQRFLYHCYHVQDEW